MATQSICFNTFKFTKKYTVCDIVEILNSVNCKSEKFIINDYDDKLIDGLYVISVPSKEIKFNMITNTYESEEVVKNIVTNFIIDVESEIIEIWGNRINSQRILTKLALQFNNNVIIDSIKIDLLQVILSLKKYKFKVGKVKIEDVLLKENLIATCMFDLTNHEQPYKILEEYKSKITQISATINEVSGQLLTIAIFSSGSILVYRSREDIGEEVLSIIRKVCIGGGI